MEEKNQLKYIYYIGIGAFNLQALLELTALFKNALNELQIILNIKPITNYFISELTSLIFFSIITFWIVNWFKKDKVSTEKTVRKSLIISIVSYVIILALHSLYYIFITEYLKSNYRESFNLYREMWKGDFISLAFISIIPILYYVIFAVIILTSKIKTVANNVYN